MSQPRNELPIILIMQRDIQQPSIFRLPTNRIIAGLRNRKTLTIGPAPLHELEAVLKAGLVCREEEAARVVGVRGRIGRIEVGAVGDAVADHAGGGYGAAVRARVYFADVRTERAVVFGDAFVAEVVVEMGVRRGVFVWIFGDGGSCCRSSVLADYHLEKNSDVCEGGFGSLPLGHRPMSFAPK